MHDQSAWLSYSVLQLQPKLRLLLHTYRTSFYCSRKSNYDSMSFPHTHWFRCMNDTLRWQINNRTAGSLSPDPGCHTTPVHFLPPFPSLTASRLISYHSNSCERCSRWLEDVSLPLVLLACHSSSSLGEVTAKQNDKFAIEQSDCNFASSGEHSIHCN